MQWTWLFIVVVVLLFFVFVQPVPRVFWTANVRCYWTWFCTACPEGCFGLQMSDAMNMVFYSMSVTWGVFWTADVWCNEHGLLLFLCACSVSWRALWTAVSDAMHVRERSSLQSSWWPVYLQRGMDWPALRQRWEPSVTVQSWQTEWIYLCSFVCWQSKVETEVSSPAVLLAIQGWNSEVNSPAVLLAIQGWNSEVNSPAVLLAIQGWNSLRLIHQLCCWQSKAETLRLIHQLCCWVRWYIYLWPFLLTHTHTQKHLILCT